MVHAALRRGHRRSVRGTQRPCRLAAHRRADRPRRRLCWRRSPSLACGLPSCWRSTRGTSIWWSATYGSGLPTPRPACGPSTFSPSCATCSSSGRWAADTTQPTSSCSRLDAADELVFPTAAGRPVAPKVEESLVSVVGLGHAESPSGLSGVPDFHVRLVEEQRNLVVSPAPRRPGDRAGRIRCPRSPRRTT